MLDVLENAGLVINVARGKEVEGKIILKFIEDQKTGAKITGMLGRKGGLEKSYYEALLTRPLENESGYKIFLFHSLLTELKPKSLEKVDSHPLSLLPKNFNYYAGGHPHFISTQNLKDYGLIAYPGPLFPNSFNELEELGNGGFYINDNNNLEWVAVKVKDVVKISLDCEHKSAEQVESIIKDLILKSELEDKIVLLRLSGTLSSGKPSDINFRELFAMIKEKSAFTILKNSSALSSVEFDDIKIASSHSSEVEAKLILEQITEKDLDIIDAKFLARKLISVLDSTKQEGETVRDFEARIKEEVDRIIN
jgi:DNA repair protein SbcD/Mre11